MSLDQFSRTYKAEMECARKLGSGTFAWGIPGLEIEAWGTHRLIHEALTEPGRAGCLADFFCCQTTECLTRQEQIGYDFQTVVSL